MKFFAFDTETTGLDAHAGDEVLSLAYVLLDDDLNELAAEQFFAHPSDPSRVSPEAARINGYSPDVWDAKGAVTQDALYLLLATAWKKHELRRAVPLGHNVPFDVGFLEVRGRKDAAFAAAMRQALGYHKIDTIGIALALDVANKVKGGSYSLGPLCARYDVELLHAHDSLYDVRATVELYRKLAACMGSGAARAQTPKERFAAAVKEQAEKIRAHIKDAG
jgi:DNA polymerase III epsilon subunit-like protein